MSLQGLGSTPPLSEKAREGECEAAEDRACGRKRVSTRSKFTATKKKDRISTTLAHPGTVYRLPLLTRKVSKVSAFSVRGLRATLETTQRETDDLCTPPLSENAREGECEAAEGHACFWDAV